MTSIKGLKIPAKTDSDIFLCYFLFLFLFFVSFLFAAFLFPASCAPPGFHYLLLLSAVEAPAFPSLSARSSCVL